MNTVRLEALRLAASCGGAAHQQVERAKMFIDFLEGSASLAGATEEASDPVQSTTEKPEGDVPRVGPERSPLQVMEDARRLLVENTGSCASAVTLEDFLRCGMPEWMAQAAVTAMREDVGEERWINASERRKDWAYFAVRYYRLAEQLRAPDNNRYP